MKQVQLIIISFILTAPAFAQILHTSSPIVQEPIENRIISERSAMIDSIIWQKES